MIEGVIIALLGSGLIQFFFNRSDKKKDTLNKVEAEISEIHRSLIRLQILNLIQHDPKNKNAILLLYDQYKSLNGNSYIDDLIKNWKKDGAKSGRIQRTKSEKGVKT